jgi:hypothetical protein
MADTYAADDDVSFEESLWADAATLKARGFASDFCGAWLALWQLIMRDCGHTIESFLNEPAAALIEAARLSYMALMSAAVRADKSKSQRRRFKCPAGLLWSYRSGEIIPEGERDDPERRRVLSNFARYWRASGWRPVFRFQKATHLMFFDCSSRDFKDNRKAAEAASFTDYLTDLINEIIRRKNSYRGGSRVERFNRAAREALENFRRRVPPFAPNAEPEQPKGGAAAETETRQRPKSINFDQAKKKILAGVQIVRARAEAGKLTPGEAEELILLLAPVVEIAQAVRLSSEEKTVLPSEDTTQFEPGVPPDLITRGRDGVSNFPAEKCKTGEVHADKNIRVDCSGPVIPDVSPSEFLSAFYPSTQQAVRLRLFKPKGAPDGPRFTSKKIPTTREALACDSQLLERLRSLNQSRGLYFVVNGGGDSDAEITCFNAFFAEMDEGTLAEQHAKLDACPIPPTIRVETLKSVHAYWLAAPGCAVEEWREVQRRLIHYFGSDPKIKNPSRVMRLPGFNHVRYSDGLLSYKPVVVAAFDKSRRFTVPEMLKAFPAVPESRSKVERGPVKEFSGSYEEHKRELGARIAAHPTARRNGRGKWDCRGVCHDGKGDTGLFYDPTDDFVWCNADPPCDLGTISRAFGMRPPPSVGTTASVTDRFVGVL